LKTFLEIGVADFDTLIPMAAKGGWCGWCVEPMPHHAETLRQKAAGLPIGICELAISDRNGEIKMAVGGGEQWATGANHIIDDNHIGFKVLEMKANEHLRQEDITVQCMTLDMFIDQKGITHLDFCKIDVEGHELNIFKDYSWRVKPLVIKCEHKHLPGGSLARILEPLGYSIFVENEDIYAIL